MRRDLIVTSCVAHGEPSWTVKDPLSLAYFRLLDVEYAALSLLDGRMTYGRLLAALQQRFPGERWSVENIKTFIGSLVRSGLVTSVFTGQWDLLGKQRQPSAWQRVMSSLTGLLAIRWRGIDPEPWLKRTDPATRWLFRPAALVVCLAAIGAAMLLVAFRWEAFVRRCPDAQTLLGLGNLPSLLVVFVGIKLLHELGHVLTCRHFGRECHELGIQVLLFVPLFYGDVTDAWMLSSRWQRIAISSAGVFAELVMAALATFLWWASVPGVLNSLFLNVMLVCSINTLLINGNPLLRYDGYYVLTDALNLPNLAGQARQAVLSLWERLLTGVSDDAEAGTRRWWLLVSYGIASAIYRVGVLFAMTWLLHHLFEPFGLSFLATLLSLLLLGSAVWLPVRELAERVHARWRQQTSPPRRIATGVGLAVLVTAAIFLVPWPYSVNAPFVVYPANAQPIFVSVTGRLESSVPAGASVKPGDVLGRLRNHDLVLQHERQQAEVARLTLRLKNLEAQRGKDEAASMRLPATRDALMAARHRLEQLNNEVQRLQLVSAANGVVLPPPNVVRLRPADDALEHWHGTPLDPANRGATLREQTLFCYVGNPAKLDAVLWIDQRDIEFVLPGQSVSLQFSSAPSQRRHGHVEEVATARTELLPRELTVAGRIAVKDTPSGPIPAEASYEVRVRLTQAADAPLFASGQARIRCSGLSLATRLWRLLRSTFAADWPSMRT